MITLASIPTKCSSYFRAILPTIGLPTYNSSSPLSQSHHRNQSAEPKLFPSLSLSSQLFWMKRPEFRVRIVSAKGSPWIIS